MGRKRLTSQPPYSARLMPRIELNWQMLAIELNCNELELAMPAIGNAMAGGNLPNHSRMLKLHA
jgi:hypothetical protein